MCNLPPVAKRVREGLIWMECIPHCESGGRLRGDGASDGIWVMCFVCTSSTISCVIKIILRCWLILIIVRNYYIWMYQPTLLHLVPNITCLSLSHWEQNTLFRFSTFIGFSWRIWLVRRWDMAINPHYKTIEP